jgi:hypothetical protein
MDKMRYVSMVFMTAILALASLPAEGQQTLAVKTQADALEEIKDNFDIAIIDEAGELVKQSTILLDQIRDKPRIDAAEFLEKIRPLRGKISKRSPMLRTLIESLQRWKYSVPYQINTYSVGNPYYTTPSPLSSAGYSGPDRLELDEATERLDKVQIQLEELQKSSTADANKQVQIDNLTEQVSEARKQKSDAEASYKKARDDQVAAQALQQENIKTQVEVLDNLIQQATTNSRNLDETLSFLDDASGSLLQANIREAAYTDRSTIIFAILVGGVIIGFFAIAFISQAVRDAIFTGDSGIQFVTLFSLVIAIILFGVLKILEGKELAALLGGLSGYILGKAGQPAVIPAVITNQSAPVPPSPVLTPRSNESTAPGAVPPPIVPSASKNELPSPGPYNQST